MVDANSILAYVLVLLIYYISCDLCYAFAPKHCPCYLCQLVPCTLVHIRVHVQQSVQVL